MYGSTVAGVGARECACCMMCTASVGPLSRFTCCCLQLSMDRVQVYPDGELNVQAVSSGPSTAATRPAPRGKHRIPAYCTYQPSACSALLAWYPAATRSWVTLQHRPRDRACGWQHPDCHARYRTQHTDRWKCCSGRREHNASCQAGADPLQFSTVAYWVVVLV